jgi:nucleotidyltransferase/DNA polymerase involved in DNA repair
MDILRQHSLDFQQVGIDEAFLSLRDLCVDYENAYIIAKTIQDQIFKQIGITCSIGCASTKSLAKIGSDLNKPNGIAVIPPDQIESILSPKDITILPGIGKKTKFHYYEKGYHLVADFFKTPIKKIIRDFGQSGEWILAVLHGKNMQSVHNHGIRKSISKERTFAEDILDSEQLWTKLWNLYSDIHSEMQFNHITYQTVTLKIRFQGFETYSRAKSWIVPIESIEIGQKLIKALFTSFLPLKKKVRLIGIRLSSLDIPMHNLMHEQMTLDKYYK